MQSFANTVFGAQNEYTGELESAVLLVSSDEAAAVYSSTESSMLSACRYIPLFYKKSFLVYNKKISDLYFNPFSHQIDFRYSKYFE
jgi:hypothetical protein